MSGPKQQYEGARTPHAVPDAAGVLGRIARVALTSAGLEGVYEDLAREAARLVGFDRMAVAIFNEERSHSALRHVAGIPVDEWVPGLVAASDRSLEGMVRLSDEGMAFEIADLLTHDPVGLIQTGSEVGLSHFMGLPLRSSNGVFGVLSFAALASPSTGPYCRADIDMAQRIADQIAGTLRLAELIHRADDRTAEVRLVAELGRVTSSAPNVEGIFSEVAPIIKELVPFDRISVAFLERGESVFRGVFVDGETLVPSLGVGVVRPVTHQGVEELMQGRRAIIIGADDLERLSKLSDVEHDCFQAGLRSKLAVSLVAGGRLVATVNFRSIKPDFYTGRHVQLAEMMASQIAGAVLNGRLFNELDRHMAETQLLADVGRVVTAQLDPSEVFAEFETIVSGVIPFDRFSVSYAEAEGTMFRNLYVGGATKVEGLELDSTSLVHESRIAGSKGHSQSFTDGHSSRVFSSEELHAAAESWWVERACLRAGLRSKMIVPLMWKNQNIAGLVFRSKVVDAYSAEHLEFASKLAAQVGGAVASQQLYEQLKAESLERRTMANIGRIMTSSMDLDRLFGVVLEQVRNLIPVDRMAVNTLNFETGTTVKVLAAGMDVSAFPTGVTAPLPASGLDIKKLLGGTQARSGSELEEFAHSYPEVDAVWQAGIRSLLHVPLVFDDDLIGVLAIGSTEENAYGDRELEIAESVSRQIVGAIANLQLSQQREFALSALGESESLFRALLQYAPNGIVVSDSKGRILLVNEQTEALFGYSARGLEGQKVDVLVPSRLRGGHPGHRDGYMAAPTSRTMGSALDLVALRKDGTEIPVDISLGPLETSDGTLIISSIRDMAETREAEIALRTSEAELSDLFENAPLGYHEGDSQGRVTRVNTTLLEMLGLSREEMVGRSVFEFVAGDSQSQAVEALEIALQARPDELATTSRTMVRKDGSHLPITADYRQIRDETGKVTGLRVSSRDVTELKRLQDQLLHAQKMEAVGQLAGGVAHDFNNILTAVMAHASLAKRGLTRADGAIVEDIDGILKAADRAAELTRQLLTFSRQDVARPEPTSLDKLLPDMDRMVRRLIGEHIELVYLLNTGNARVMIDPGQAEQVITNLVLNARDAMPGGGTITMETALVTLTGMTRMGTVFPGSAGTGNSRALEPGRYMCVSVTDTGEGMDGETLLRIFDPFFTTKEPGKGTGLGLATCYGIVVEAGGEIRVESELGRGTRFDVLLPLTNRPQDDERTNTLGPESIGRETIMFVEDEANVRESTARALRVHGYTVVEATNGAEVVGLVERGEFGDVDLLLTDMVMPLMGGVELADRLRSMNIDVRTLFISGYKGGETAGNRDLRPDESYLPKPYLFEKLLTEIRSLLDAR